MRGWCCFSDTRFGAAPAALDGVVSLPLRLLDAPTSPEACGNAIAPVCTLRDTTAASYSATRIACTVSPGVGSGFQLLIRDVWTSLVANGARAGYRPPQVSTVTPSLLPVGGGNVTVTGMGFGPSPCPDANRTSEVQLLVTAAPDPAGVQPVYSATSGTWGPSSALVPGFAPCAVLSWSPTAIVCAAPPGLDASVAVRVTVGGQAMTAGGRMGYAPPAVTAVAALQPLGTSGGGVVCVTGTSLPPLQWPLAVLVGGSLCTMDASGGTRNATTVCCGVPRGAGWAAVVVSTPLQASGPVEGMHVLYAAPEVAEVLTPQGRSVDGGFPVLVRGVVRAHREKAPRVTSRIHTAASVRVSLFWCWMCRTSMPMDEQHGVRHVRARLCVVWLQNFFPGPIMEVTIGTQPCAGVVITDNATLGELMCVAPAGPGFGAVQLRVTVEGSGTGSIRFAYDAPSVTQVLGSPCDAAAVCPIQVRPALLRA
jgi:hypothetical protein